MAVGGGDTMDSRQPIEDDPWSLVSQLALTGSMLWWRTALSDPRHDRFRPGCLLLRGERQTVKELLPDRRVQVLGLEPGR